MKKISFKLKTPTTCHGIENIIRNDNKIIKLIWIICFSISIGACLYFLNEQIQEYLRFNKLTSVEVVFEKESQFPAISICDKNHNLTLDQITFCQINTDLGCLYNPENYFEKFYDHHYSKFCLRFNSGRNFKNQHVKLINSNYPGYKEGFWLDFNKEASIDFDNMIIHVHNASLKPFSLYNKGIKISAGKVNYFSVERLFIHKLGEPFNHCFKDTNAFNLNKTLIDYIIGTNRSYSQRECLGLCFNLLYIEKNACNCTSKLESVNDVCYGSLNYYTSLWNCTKKFRKIFSENLFDKNCFQYCPLECDSIDYQLSVSYTGFPLTGNISENDKLNWFQKSSDFHTYEQVQRNYYSIAVFYEELKYLLITEQPSIELSDLISNIGGILGVFLGISFLSFIEIIDFIFYFCKCIRE